MDTVHKIGRRKTAVARIYLSEGKGNITVNKKDYKDYFTTGTLQYKVQQPLMLTGDLESYDIKVNVYGGGVTGSSRSNSFGNYKSFSCNQRRTQISIKTRRFTNT